MVLTSVHLAVIVISHTLDFWRPRVHVVVYFLIKRIVREEILGNVRVLVPVSRLAQVHGLFDVCRHTLTTLEVGI